MKGLVLLAVFAVLGVLLQHATGIRHFWFLFAFIAFTLWLVPESRRWF